MKFQLLECGALPEVLPKFAARRSNAEADSRRLRGFNYSKRLPTSVQFHLKVKAEESARPTFLGTIIFSSVLKVF